MGTGNSRESFTTTGLPSAEAARRLGSDGPNVLPSGEREGFLRMLAGPAIRDAFQLRTVRVKDAVAALVASVAGRSAFEIRKSVTRR